MSRYSGSNVDRPMDMQEAMEEHDPVDLSVNEFQDATVDLDMSAAAPGHALSLRRRPSR